MQRKKLKIQFLEDKPHKINYKKKKQAVLRIKRTYNKNESKLSGYWERRSAIMINEKSLKFEKMN